jgi:hypothetical protein
MMFSMLLTLLILLLLVALAVSAAIRSRTWRRVLVTVGCLVAIVVSAYWAHGIYRRPNLVASWLNLKEPPKSLKVLDCQDSMLITDVDSNCLIAIAPEHFDELLAGYDFHDRAFRSDRVALATGTRKFATAHMYSVTPPSFEHGGAVTIYVNSLKNQAIINLYVE